VTSTHRRPDLRRGRRWRPAAARRALVPLAAVLVLALAAPGARAALSPPGANDWSCHPTAAHPRPVVLVHGTFENMAANWASLSPRLKLAGYCVFALNYGAGPYSAQTFYGIAHIPGSAQELAAFVDRVRAATGAAQVDLVGHSQGGMMPRYYLRFLGGAARVHALVALSPSNHGTTVDGLQLLAPRGTALLLSACPACVDQLRGSAFLTQLNAGGDTVPGVSYTVIETRYDEVVTPYTSAFLSGSDVTDILLQDQCPADVSEHLGTPYDRLAQRDVLNALDPAHARPASCLSLLDRSR
jgi:triacylglycerol esterase/lipase EstA (alpha/beta hydrolase family)